MPPLQVPLVIISIGVHLLCTCGISSLPHKAFEENVATMCTQLTVNYSERVNNSLLAFFSVHCLCLMYMQRKLLVEKRVVLDDIPNAERKSDRLLATLPPRSPTIQRDENSPGLTKLRTSKSEYNVSRSKSSTLMHGAEPQPARANRLATSISVGNSLSTHPRSANSDVFGSWKVHDINEAREPRNVNSFTEPVRVNANERMYVATSTLGRVNSAVTSSSQQARIGAYSAAAGQQVGTGHTRTDRDQRKRVTVNADSTRSVGHGARPHSGPPKLSHQPMQVKDTECSDSMGAQYEPGNVRHLVQTFQSAFRPVTTPECGDTAVEQTSVRAGSRPAVESRQLSAARYRLQTAEKQSHRQTGGDTTQEQRWPSSQRSLQPLPPRTETNVNVCVVRPATGRTLPRPPTPDPSQSLATCRPSEPFAQELPNQVEQSDPRSSNKVSKLWQAYGCL